MTQIVIFFAEFAPNRIQIRTGGTCFVAYIMLAQPIALRVVLAVFLGYLYNFFQAFPEAHLFFAMFFQLWVEIVLADGSLVVTHLGIQYPVCGLSLIHI